MTGKKVTIVTNAILVCVFTAVFCVSFFSQTPVPIYGGKEISAIYNGNRSGKKISLMFNVYENSDVVEKIVDVLDLHGAKATFFVGGCWADDNATTLNKIVQSGHELGNHGYFHKDHKNLNYQRNKEEMHTTNVLVTALSGVKVTLFAPPSGSFGANTLEAAFDLGLKVVMWSKDTIDWRDKDQNQIFSRATKNLSGGDLILMHPKEHTLQALPQIIKYAKDGGYALCTVSENLGDSTL